MAEQSNQNYPWWEEGQEQSVFVSKELKERQEKEEERQRRRNSESKKRYPKVYSSNGTPASYPCVKITMFPEPNDVVHNSAVGRSTDPITISYESRPKVAYDVPRFVESFSISKADDSGTGAKCRFTLVSDKAFDLEYYLTIGWKKVGVQYGVNKHDPNYAVVRNMMIERFDVKITQYGSRATVEACSLGYMDCDVALDQTRYDTSLIFNGVDSDAIKAGINDYIKRLKLEDKMYVNFVDPRLKLLVPLEKSEVKFMSIDGQSKEDKAKEEEKEKEIKIMFPDEDDDEKKEKKEAEKNETKTEEEKISVVYYDVDNYKKDNIIIKPASDRGGQRLFDFLSRQVVPNLKLIGDEIKKGQKTGKQYIMPEAQIRVFYNDDVCPAHTHEAAGNPNVAWGERGSFDDTPFTANGGLCQINIIDRTSDNPYSKEGSENFEKGVCQTFVINAGETNWNKAQNEEYNFKVEDWSYNYDSGPMRGLNGIKGIFQTFLKDGSGIETVQFNEVVATEGERKIGANELTEKILEAGNKYIFADKSINTKLVTLRSRALTKDNEEVIIEDNKLLSYPVNCTNQTEAIFMVQTLLASRTASIMTASLTSINTSGIDLCDNIRVIVYGKNNVVHPSSGIYKVIAVDEDISGGLFKATYSLVLVELSLPEQKRMQESVMAQAEQMAQEDTMGSYSSSPKPTVDV